MPVRKQFAAFDQRLDSLERRVAVEGETSRRHMDVIAEEFRILVRLGLDRQMATEQQIRSLATSHAEDHAVSTAAIQDHETRLRALEPRDSGRRDRLASGSVRPNARPSASKRCRCEFVQPIAACTTSCSLRSDTPPGNWTRRQISGRILSNATRSW